VITISI